MSIPLISRILVTGSNGQLGSELRALSSHHQELHFTFTDIAELDITSSDAVESFFEDGDFHAVINCAAYTAVDKAESDRETAAKVNTLAVRNLAQACQARDILLIHISTDYVFDGKGYKPYTESDGVNPIGVYSQTKWEGEEAIRKVCNRAVIIRTAWLYSAYGHNFVKTIQRIAAANDAIRIVFDQVGTPTHAADLAALIVDHLDKFLLIESNELFHYTNEGVASWYDFAHAIVQMEDLKARVLPIMSADYPTPAARPHYSLLNKAKIKSFLQADIPHWRESLRRCLNEIHSMNKQ